MYKIIIYKIIIIYIYNINIFIILIKRTNLLQEFEDDLKERFSKHEK